jgi:hypothetical protein
LDRNLVRAERGVAEPRGNRARNEERPVERRRADEEMPPDPEQPPQEVEPKTEAPMRDVEHPDEERDPHPGLRDCGSGRRALDPPAEAVDEEGHEHDVHAVRDDLDQQRRPQVGDATEVALPAEQEERERQPDHRDPEVLDGVLRRLAVDADQLDDRLGGEAEGDRERGPDPEREPERLRAEPVRGLPRARADGTGDLRSRPVREEVEHREEAAEHEACGPERGELRRTQVADDRGVDEHERRLGGERPEREDGEAEDLPVVRRAPQCGDHAIAVRYAAT